MNVERTQKIVVVLSVAELVDLLQANKLSLDIQALPADGKNCTLSAGAKAVTLVYQTTAR